MGKRHIISCILMLVLLQGMSPFTLMTCGAVDELYTDLVVSGSQDITISADTNLTGNVTVKDNGILRITDADLTVNQSAAFQFSINISGNGRLVMTNANLASNASIRFTMAGSSELSLTGSSIKTYSMDLRGKLVEFRSGSSMEAAGIYIYATDYLQDNSTLRMRGSAPTLEVDSATDLLITNSWLICNSTGNAKWAQIKLTSQDDVRISGSYINASREANYGAAQTTIQSDGDTYIVGSTVYSRTLMGSMAGTTISSKFDLHMEASSIICDSGASTELHIDFKLNAYINDSLLRSEAPTGNGHIELFIMNSYHLREELRITGSHLIARGSGTYTFKIDATSDVFLKDTLIQTGSEDIGKASILSNGDIWAENLTHEMLGPWYAKCGLDISSQNNTTIKDSKLSTTRAWTPTMKLYGKKMLTIRDSTIVDDQDLSGSSSLLGSDDRMVVERTAISSGNKMLLNATTAVIEGSAITNITDLTFDRGIFELRNTTLSFFNVSPYATVHQFWWLTYHIYDTRLGPVADVTVKLRSTVTDEATYSTADGDGRGATWAKSRTATAVNDTFVGDYEMSIDYKNSTFTKGGIVVKNGTHVDFPIDSNERPRIEITSPANNSLFEDSQAFNLTSTASDPEDGGIQDKYIVWSSNVTGELGRGARITVHDLGLGSHRISVSCNDSRGLTAKAEVLITVFKGNGPPTISPILKQFATVGQAFTYQVQGDDPDLVDVTSLVYSIVKGPSGMVIGASSGLLTWTPTTAQVGSNQVTVRVSDGKAHADTSFEVFVTAVANSPPRFVSEPALQAGVGEEWTYQSAVVDDDGDTVEVSLRSGPTGMTFSLGTLRWVPVAAQTGANVVSLRAADRLVDVFQNFTVVVTTAPPANHPPVPGPAAPVSFREGDLLSVQLNATDKDGDMLTYALINGPPGLTVSSTGMVTWQTEKGDNGTYEVLVRVSDGLLNATAVLKVTVQRKTAGNGGLPLLTIALVGIIVAVVAAVAALLLIRRRKGKEPQSPPRAQAPQQAPPWTPPPPDGQMPPN